MKRRACLALLAAWPLAGCLSSPSQLAKTDIDRIADLHRRELQAGLLRLADKLYKRNPREWRKGGHASLAAALAHLATQPPPAPGTPRGGALVLAGMREDYAKDRVAAFVGGLLQMVSDAFDGKTEFFVTDDLDAQRLYNAARNLEIAAWKLANTQRTQPEADLPAGMPLLFSNEMGVVPNLSFEREFGRMIGSLDLLSKIIADKTSRTVVKVVQNLATAVFLPI